MNFSVLDKMTDAQLLELNSAIVKVMRSRREEKIWQAKREIRVGSVVKFASSKRGGEMIHIKVTKINIKTIEGKQLGGDQEGMGWKVTASLCEPVTDKPAAIAEVW